MKFNLPEKVEQQSPDPRVGDLYYSKGTGPRSYRKATCYWLLVGITQGRCYDEVHHFLGLDAEGNINSTTTYGGHVARGWEWAGFVPELAELNFAVEAS